MLISQKLVEDCKELLPETYSLPNMLLTLQECLKAIFKAALHHFHKCFNKLCNLLPNNTEHNLENISKFYFSQFFKFHPVLESDSKEWVQPLIESKTFEL